MIDAAKQEKYYPELEAQLNALKAKIENSKQDDLVRFRPEIKQVLEEQIGFAYDLNEGQADISLQRDNAVFAAQKVLHDRSTYMKLLAITNAQDPKP